MPELAAPEGIDEQDRGPPEGDKRQQACHREEDEILGIEERQPQPHAASAKFRKQRARFDKEGRIEQQEDARDGDP